jgi:hypothetical protein
VGKDKQSLIAGAVQLVVGMTLYLTTEGVETPVVTLTKVGVVLMALGALELVATAAWMLWGTRRATQ